MKRQEFNYERALGRIPENQAKYIQNLPEEERKELEIIARTILSKSINGLGEGGAIELAISIHKWVLEQKIIRMMKKVPLHKTKKAINYLERQLEKEF